MPFLETDLLKDGVLLKLPFLESILLMLPCLDGVLFRLDWQEGFFVGCLEGDLQGGLDEDFAKDLSPRGDPSSCSTSLDGALVKRLDICLDLPVMDVNILVLDTSLMMDDDDLTLVMLELLVTLLLGLLSSSEMSCLVDCRRKVPILPSPLALLLDACRAPASLFASLLLLLTCMFKERDIRFT